MIFGILKFPFEVAEFFQIVTSEYGHYVFKGSFTGIPIGFLLGFWDMVRNRQNQISLLRLAGNFFWCIPIGFLLSVVNSFLFDALSSFWVNNNSFPPDWFTISSYLAVGIPNFTAIIWAAIRSITTDDVLTPRVLRDKLRRSSRIIT